LVIGVVCFLRPEKGLPTLVEAFADVRILAPNLRLAIIGSGPVLSQLQSLALSACWTLACSSPPPAGWRIG
jgi:glycosyltransferase involved in cell wall biosynthesis